MRRLGYENLKSGRNRQLTVSAYVILPKLIMDVFYPRRQWTVYLTALNHEAFVVEIPFYFKIANICVYVLLIDLHLF